MRRKPICCVCNILSLTVANATVCEHFKRGTRNSLRKRECCIYNSGTMLSALQRERSGNGSKCCICNVIWRTKDVASAISRLKLLRLQQYNIDQCVANATHQPWMLQISQCQNTPSVAFATVLLLWCCKCNITALFVLQKQQYNPKLLRMQQWNVLPVLHMQQYSCLSVANATIQT